MGINVQIKSKLYNNGKEVSLKFKNKCTDFGSHGYEIWNIKIKKCHWKVNQMCKHVPMKKNSSLY